jgi:hypothetical protein
MSKKSKKEIPYVDYHEYINSPEWLKKKRQAYWCLGKTCEVCSTSKRIHVHHNNYVSLGFERAFRDFVILCAACHEAFHEVVSSQDLGRRYIGYTHKCSLCMKNKHKQSKYVSCSTSLRTKQQKERKNRILRICEVCATALSGRLLVENKTNNREIAKRKKQEKRRKRLLRSKSRKKTLDTVP